MNVTYKQFAKGLVLTLLIMCGHVKAHNSVVVIPMAGDDVEVGIHLDRTQIVGGSGTATENGDALLEAVTFVNEQVPTETSPWLIKLEPGVYDIGVSTVALLDYVSIQGAGMRISKITSSTSSVVLTPGDGAQISELWVDSSHSSSGDVECILLSGDDNVTIRNVKLTNVGALADGLEMINTTGTLVVGLEAITTDFAVFLTGGSNVNVIIRDSLITSTGDEAFNAGNAGDTSVIENSTISSTGTNTSAINSFGGSTVIRQSSLISDSGGSVLNSGATSTIEIYNSFVDVDDSFATHFTGGTSNCYGITTPTSFSATTCQ